MWSKVLLAAGLLAPAFAQTCTYSISPASNPNVPAGGGSFGPVSVIAVGTNCRWTAASNVPWIKVIFGQSGNGNGSFGYGVDPNSGPTRTGTITAAGFTYSVSQAGCSFAFSPAPAQFPFGGGSDSFTVSPTPSSCTWTPTTTSDWITVTSGQGGPGSGTASYTVAANPLPSVRVGNITVGAQSFPITQAAAPCTTTLTPTTANVVAGGVSGTFRVTVTPSACAWTATSASTFITVTSGANGTNTGTVGYTVAANTGPERPGSIRVNDQSFNITQAAAACAYTAIPDQNNFGVQGGSSVVAIATSAGCSWTAASNATWITVAAPSGSGPTRLTFTVAANTGAARTVTMTIAGQPVNIAQDGITARTPQLTSVVNAAAYGSGPISAGEVVTLRGSALGPDTLVNIQNTPDGLGVTTIIAGTRVLFDGVPAPMVYAWGPQVSAIAPYGIASQSTTRLQVEYQGVLSNAMTLNVAAATPGIFTIDPSGMGPGAVLNEDDTVNTPATPATVGSVVQIFATGGGQTDPAGMDGKFVGVPYPKLVLPVAVRIGGLDSVVQYAGGAPGLIAGLVQVNAVVPDGVQTSIAVPIELQVGDVTSPNIVTIAIAPR